MRADCDLVWYYNDSPAALGLSSAPLSPEPRDSLPQQKWPSARQCADVRRQKSIREALRQLSPRLQCILECAYEARGITLQDSVEFDLCAPLMARIMQRLRLCRSAEDKEKLKEIAKSAPVLLQTAHAAFRIAFGPAMPKSRPDQRRARVSRWVADELQATA